MKLLFLSFLIYCNILPICFINDSTWFDPTLNQTPAVSPSIEQVDHVVASFMSTYNVPGMSVAITRNGKLVYAKSYGKADIETGEDANNSSLYRIASLSKPITSITIMKFIEQGKLSMDSKVFGTDGLLGTDYGTQPYKSYVSDITIRDLLHHTAGGWSNNGSDPMFTNPSMSQIELISSTLDNISLKNKPGTVYAYSNFGYNILGRIIEKITGQSYEQYIKTTILQSAGITDMQISGNTLSDRKINEVKYYGQGGENPYSFNITRMDSHGGWLATATDLARLMVKADGFSSKPDMLNTSTISIMKTPSAANPNYACGWAVNGADNWWHTGSLPGTATEMVRASNGFCWILLCNTRNKSNQFFTDLDELIWKPVNDNTTRWPTKDLF